MVSPLFFPYASPVNLTSNVIVLHFPELISENEDFPNGTCWIFMNQRWLETIRDETKTPAFSLRRASLRMAISNHYLYLLPDLLHARFRVYPECTHGLWKGLALVAWQTGAAFRRKRGDASVHIYNFNEAAVVYQDIQGRLNNDLFVLTALLSLVHQPHILSSSTFFFFFYFFFFL